MSKFSRRQVLLLGALALTGCGRRSSSSGSQAAIPFKRSNYTTANTYIYHVQPGDTLSSISRRSMPKCDVGKIISYNGLKSHNIKVGQQLRLPGVQSLNMDPLAKQLNRELASSAKSSQTKLKTTSSGRYQLVRRSQWTKQSVRSNNRPMGSVLRITVHHTGEHKGMNRRSDIDVVKAIENYHRNERKWAAIGYHFLVGRDGRVYEGRPVRYQGAHVRSNNRNNIGISLIGDFNKHRPNAKQLASLQKILDEKRRKHRVPKRMIFGHRDLGPSECPGRHLYAWVKKYRAT